MTPSFIAIIFIIPVYQLLFYTTQLVTFDKKTNISRWYIGLLFVCLTTLSIINATYYYGNTQTFGWSFYLFMPILLLITPLFYKYLINITGINKHRLANNNLVLFMPSVVFLALNLIVYGGLAYGDKVSSLMEQSPTNQSTNTNLLQLLAHIIYKSGSVFVFIQLFYYTIKSISIINISKLKKEENTIILSSSKIEKISYVLYSVVLFVLLNAIFIQITFHNTGIVIAYNLIVLITGFIIGNFALKQLNYYQFMLKNSHQTAQRVYTHKTQPSKSMTKTKNNESQTIIQSLNELMISEKPYLDSKLTLNDLAHMLNVKKRDLSNAINNETNLNVYTFINEYRIHEFIKLVQNPEMELLSIEGLAQKVGFNSKSSFNTCFKRITGTTPSEFKKNIKSKNLDANKVHPINHSA